MKTKTALIILLTLSISSCALLNKQKLGVKTKSEKERVQIESLQTSERQKKQLFVMDSSHNDFTILIWPKGTFKFSAAQGFEGEAEKLVMRGKHTQQQTLSITNEIKKDSAALSANYIRTKNSSQTLKKDKVSMGYSWSWIIGILILGIAVWAYRKLRH